MFGQSSMMLVPSKLTDTAEALLEMAKSKSSILQETPLLRQSAHVAQPAAGAFPSVDIDHAAALELGYTSIAVQRAKLRLAEKSQRLQMMRSAEASYNFLRLASALNPPSGAFPFRGDINRLVFDPQTPLIVPRLTHLSLTDALSLPRGNFVLDKFTPASASTSSAASTTSAASMEDRSPSPASTVASVNSVTKQSKVCKMDGCKAFANQRTQYCTKHSGSRKCEHTDCTKSAQGKTRFCIGHGGGRRCRHVGCNKGARDRNFCAAHGGGKRCRAEGCKKLAVPSGKSLNFCVRHGGGKRCVVQGCDKSAQSGTSKCVRHGGGRQCKVTGCSKVARGKTWLCMAHGKCPPPNVDTSFCTPTSF